MIKFLKELKFIRIIYIQYNFGILFSKILVKNYYLLLLIKIFFLEYFIESGLLKLNLNKKLKKDLYKLK